MMKIILMMILITKSNSNTPVEIPSPTRVLSLDIEGLLDLFTIIKSTKLMMCMNFNTYLLKVSY